MKKWFKRDVLIQVNIHNFYTLKFCSFVEKTYLLTVFYLLKVCLLAFLLVKTNFNMKISNLLKKCDLYVGDV